MVLLEIVQMNILFAGLGWGKSQPFAPPSCLPFTGFLLGSQSSEIQWRRLDQRVQPQPGIRTPSCEANAKEEWAVVEAPGRGETWVKARLGGLGAVRRGRRRGPPAAEARRAGPYVLPRKH